MVAQLARRRASTVVSRIQSLIDRVAPPETRRQLTSNAKTFANEQPLLASFLFTQLALSALPLLLFVSFALGTAILSFFAAVAFAAFWIGAALLVLLPTLFLTGSAGILIWLWAVGSFLVGRFLYRLTFVRTEEYSPNQTTSISDISISDVLPNGVASSLQIPRKEINSSPAKTAPAFSVPAVVKDSMSQAQESAEAAGNSEALEEKKEMEAELLKGVPTEES
ncbi:MAG: hypothetical protein M1833_000114 [Piccolia ochrophora]|nr:MAG: hypothetical protein M1833_000114 [Piccolia ochrophora]